MKFSYNWLQSYFNKKLPKPEKLAELLTMRSFETESEGDILNIDVLPNRAADCYSHLGIAKEISAILNYSMIEVEPQSLKSNYRGSTSIVTEDYVAVEVQEPKLCPRYIALLVKNVKIAESPEWLKERLLSIGQKPINNVVDIGNYVMLETGQPLHSFDLAKIDKRKIIVRKAKTGEMLETLDNKRASLSPDILVIADADEPMVIAGIKGGKKAGIDKNTKDIIIEAAVFNSFGIRQASQKINVKTDASIRFEHGLSLYLPESAIWRAGCLIQEVAGGQVAAEWVDVCSEKLYLPEVFFKEEDISKAIGANVPGKEAVDILKRLGFFVSYNEGVYLARPPIERIDINIKEDIFEEITRIHGYEKIPFALPIQTSVLPEINEEYVYSNWVRSILVDSGFTEVYNYSFWKAGKTPLANPISSDKAYLRMDLLAGLRVSLTENFKNFDTVKLFEIGKTFNLEEEKMPHVAVVIGDKKNKTNVAAELRGAAGALFIDEADNYIKDNVFEINLEQVVAAAKEKGIDPQEIPEFEAKDFEYKPFSKYPAIFRDISIFVPLDSRIEEITDVIENTGGEFLADSDLFDEYMPSDEDKKSLAFRLTFQSFEKTLTDKEVNKIMDKIINALEQNIQWQVRK